MNKKIALAYTFILSLGSIINFYVNDTISVAHIIVFSISFFAFTSLGIIFLLGLSQKE